MLSSKKKPKKTPPKEEDEEIEVNDRIGHLKSFIFNGMNLQFFN